MTMPDWVWVLVIVGSAAITYFAVMALGGDAERRAPVPLPEPEQAKRPSQEPRETPAPSAPASSGAAPVAKHASSAKVLTAASVPPTRMGSGAVPTNKAITDDTVPMKSAPVPRSALPRFDYEDDEEVDPTKVTHAAVPTAIQPPTKRIVYDEDAAADEPTNAGDLILVTATAQTDKGQRRKRNEDSLLVFAEENLFVVADGMGGYNGGEIASRIAVDTMEAAFKAQTFAGEAHSSIPWRASELARAIQMANAAILERASHEHQLAGMGTTVCAARFSPRKQRLYVGHVGDSRMYRLRGNTFEQITSDHTMSTLGVTGDGAAHLSRAVGVWPTVPIDIIIGLPLPGDLYLICSDGLTKMLPDTDLRKFLLANTRTPMQEVADSLVARANAAGGKDNITLILIGVRDAIGEQAAIAKSQMQAG